MLLNKINYIEVRSLVPCEIKKIFLNSLYSDIFENFFNCLLN